MSDSTVISPCSKRRFMTNDLNGSDLDGILCDLDGTLVDSEPYHLEAWNILAARCGYAPDPRWNRDCIGLPDIHTSEKAVRLFPEMAKLSDPVAAKQDIFRELVVRRGAALTFPGVAEGLASLSAAGLALAVGTNSLMRNTRATLEAAGLSRFFPVIVTLDTAARGKPSPDIYLAAAGRLGLLPERCAVLEDSPAGVAAGKAAGCLTLGVMSTWTADQLPGADRYFSATSDAIEWILATRGPRGAVAPMSEI